MSAERVIGALDRHVGRESFYVAVGRVKRELRLYASEDLDRLIERVERSRAKENPGEVVLLDTQTDAPGQESAAANRRPQVEIISLSEGLLDAAKAVASRSQAELER